MIEPTKELWAIVDEDDNVMVRCKYNRWNPSKVVKRDVLVYASEKNALAGWKQLSYMNLNLRVKRLGFKAMADDEEGDIKYFQNKLFNSLEKPLVISQELAVTLPQCVVCGKSHVLRPSNADPRTIAEEAYNIKKNCECK